MLNKVAYGYPAELIGETEFNGIPVRYEGYIDEYSGELKFNLYVGQAVMSGLNSYGDWHDKYGKMPFAGSPDLYKKFHEDVVKKTAKKYDIDLPKSHNNTTDEYFFSKDGKVVGPGFTSDEHMFTAVCKQCGEENPYRYYDPNYVCKRCQMMADWAKSAKNKSNIINKLANLYFLKSLAMDVVQARQLLKVPEGASIADIERAYKIKQHAIYMRTGQYTLPPELDAAKNILINDLQKPKSVPEVSQSEKEVEDGWDYAMSLEQPDNISVKDVYDEVIAAGNLEYIRGVVGGGEYTKDIDRMIMAIDNGEKLYVNAVYSGFFSLIGRANGELDLYFIGNPSKKVSLDDFKRFLELFKHIDKTDDMDDDLIDYLNSYVDDVFAKGYSDSVNRLEGVVNRHNLPSSILGRILLGYILKMSVPSSKIPASLAKKMAAHQNASRLILSQLETHEHPAVREQVARNKNTGTDILAYLSTDHDFHVRLAVAANPNTTDNILKRLKDDVEPGISSLAKGRLGIP